MEIMVGLRSRFKPQVNLDHPFQFPYVSYTKEIDDFCSAVSSFVMDHPDMGLEQYKEILNANRIDIDAIKNVDVSECNAQCVCAMIVANVRAEKFCEGAILGSCMDKSFLKWLERLKESDDH